MKWPENVRCQTVITSTASIVTHVNGLQISTQPAPLTHSIVTKQLAVATGTVSTWWLWASSGLTVDTSPRRPTTTGGGGCSLTGRCGCGDRRQRPAQEAGRTDGGKQTTMVYDAGAYAASLICTNRALRRGFTIHATVDATITVAGIEL